MKSTCTYQLTDEDIHILESFVKTSDLDETDSSKVAAVEACHASDDVEAFERVLRDYFPRLADKVMRVFDHVSRTDDVTLGRRALTKILVNHPKLLQLVLQKTPFYWKGYTGWTGRADPNDPLRRAFHAAKHGAILRDQRAYKKVLKQNAPLDKTMFAIMETAAGLMRKLDRASIVPGRTRAVFVPTNVPRRLLRLLEPGWPTDSILFQDDPVSPEPHPAGTPPPRWLVTSDDRYDQFERWREDVGAPSIPLHDPSYMVCVPYVHPKPNVYVKIHTLDDGATIDDQFLRRTIAAKHGGGTCLCLLAHQPTTGMDSVEVERACMSRVPVVAVGADDVLEMVADCSLASCLVVVGSPPDESVDACIGLCCNANRLDESPFFVYMHQDYALRA